MNQSFLICLGFIVGNSWLEFGIHTNGNQSDMVSSSKRKFNENDVDFNLIDVSSLDKFIFYIFLIFDKNAMNIIVISFVYGFEF